MRPGFQMNVILRGPSDRPLLAIPAMFFCIGERVQRHPGIPASRHGGMAARAVRAVREGHELGNHMGRDQWSIRLARDEFLQQLEQTAAPISDDLAAAGLKAPLQWFSLAGSGVTHPCWRGPPATATGRCWAASGRWVAWGLLLHSGCSTGSRSGWPIPAESSCCTTPRRPSRHPSNAAGGGANAAAKGILLRDTEHAAGPWPCWSSAPGMRCDWLSLEQRRANRGAGAELAPPFGHLHGFQLHS